MKKGCGIQGRHSWYQSKVEPWIGSKLAKVRKRKSKYRKLENRRIERVEVKNGIGWSHGA